MTQNGNRPTKTKAIKSEQVYMIINGSTLLSFEIVAKKLGELMPDGVAVVGYRVKGGDLELDTQQPLK